MSKRYNRETRRVRAVARQAMRPPETIASLVARLGQLPKFGNSKKEIAKIQAKITALELSHARS